MSQSGRTDTSVTPAEGKLRAALRAVPKRWLRVGLLAVGVFAINVAGRLVVRLGSFDDPELEDRVGVFALVGIALTMAVVAVVWGRARQAGEAAAELAGGGILGGMLSLFVGPFISGGNFWGPGLDEFLRTAGLFVAYAGVGALLGMFLVTMFGQDYRSRSLTQFAEAKLSKPGRGVRA